jgi:hypothetical protein
LTVAIVAGLATALLAATLVMMIARRENSLSQMPTYVSTPVSQTMPQPLPSLENVSPPSRESTLPERSPTVTAVSRHAQPNARARKVRPKFPDAFQGEVRVHEEVVARPKEHAESIGTMANAETPPDTFSGSDSKSELSRVTVELD